PFELFDPKSSGFVTAKDFVRACALLNCQIEDDEANALLSRMKMVYPKTPPGRLDYMKLFRFVREQPISKMYNSKTSEINKYICPAQLKSALRRIRIIVAQSSQTRGQSFDFFS